MRSLPAVVFFALLVAGCDEPPHPSPVVYYDPAVYAKPKEPDPCDSKARSRRILSYLHFDDDAYSSVGEPVRSDVDEDAATIADGGRRFAVNPRTYVLVGKGHWVKKNLDGGSYIILEDGSLWQVESLDKIDAMLWLAVSSITVRESSSGLPGYDYVLINTDEGRMVHAKYMGGE